MSFLNKVKLVHYKRKCYNLNTSQLICGPESRSDENLRSDYAHLNMLILRNRLINLAATVSKNLN